MEYAPPRNISSSPRSGISHKRTTISDLFLFAKRGLKRRNIRREVVARLTSLRRGNKEVGRKCAAKGRSREGRLRQVARGNSWPPRNVEAVIGAACVPI